MYSTHGRSLFSNRVALFHAMLLVTSCALPTIAQAETSALEFVPVTQCRVADTRKAVGNFGGPELAAGSTRTFNIPQSACGIPSTAVAYSLNVTALPDANLGWLTIWPAGQPKPLVSTLNSHGRLVKANAAITAAGTNGGVSVYVTDSTQFLLDIDGYFVTAGTDTSSLQFFPLAPCRVVDTRKGIGPLAGPSLSRGATRSFPIQSGSCGIPSTAKAYSLNITAVPFDYLQYMTAWPSGQAQPATSTLNSSAGSATANAAIVGAGTNGGVSIFATTGSDVLIDVNGYFAAPASGGLSYYPVTECRVLDTRSGAGTVNGTRAIVVQDSPCAPPAAAQAYVLNATVVPSNTLEYLALWADGTPQPGTSTLNAPNGYAVSNMAIVSNTDGIIDSYSTNPTQLVVDLSGYFAP